MMKSRYRRLFELTYQVAAFAVLAAPAAIAATGPSATGALHLTPEPITPGTNCDDRIISADLGRNLQVLRCYPGWAYVTNGELGDATSLVRLVEGTWSAYSGFPSDISCSTARSDGVPAAELGSFVGCPRG